MYRYEFVQMMVRKRQTAAFVSDLALARVLGWGRRNYRPERNMHYTLVVLRHTGYVRKSLFENEFCNHLNATLLALVATIAGLGVADALFSMQVRLYCVTRTIFPRHRT